ncbi:ATP-binding protein [Sunxiuqinia indica]|uniref:ATP-binding protein n=1 Tax=Sunxiuqinia indica TaxID=2692584 RepID=UPI001358A303|nr:ATP-binding protein [Sunxiuqinia indica]
MISQNNNTEVSLKNSIFKVGRVFSIEGRTVKVKVDKQKNASHLLYKGELIKNVSVGSYIKIAKGYTFLIGKVDGEYIREDKAVSADYGKDEDRIDRILNVMLLGYIENGKFERGIKELPLIENECFLIDKEEFNLVHSFVKGDDISIKIGSLSNEPTQPIFVGINSLFASHIGIFGNTGSGKSYTLAKLYRQLFQQAISFEAFKKNAKFILFDFNGEYNDPDVIIKDKKVYNLSTRNKKEKDKLPLSVDDLLNLDLISIMANATEKTQQPFLSRVIKNYKKTFEKDEPEKYFIGMLKNKIYDVFSMSDKIKAFLLLDYFQALLLGDENREITLADDIDWHNNDNRGFFIKPLADHKYLSSNQTNINKTKLFKQIQDYKMPENIVSCIIDFAYFQLIQDVLNNRAQNEHIAPAINKLKSFQREIEEVIDTTSRTDIWDNQNFIVINLNEVNLGMKKMLPMLISHKVYSEHKQHKKEAKSLNVIIDEAHNILSYVSQRESETWKDYRLETFEEIIKEGRKFGVFLTIASQRPSDISATIISQLHNYFIHRLINEKDLQMVENTISYLDKASAETLPILPTGTCAMAGQLAQLPVIVAIDPIENKVNEPHNKTLDLVNIWTKESAVNGKEMLKETNGVKTKKK